MLVAPEIRVRSLRDLEVHCNEVAEALAGQTDFSPVPVTA